MSNSNVGTSDEPPASVGTAVGTEVDVIGAARDGDRDAFRDLYLEHVRPIFGFLVSRTDAATAEDLTAETFARAFAAIQRFRIGEAPFRAWLFRIARNLIVERGRRDRVDYGVAVDIVDPDATTEDVAMASGAAQHLHQCLASLSESHQTVLELRFLRELSVRETALVLGSTEEAVRALTHRALRALRRLYADAPARR